MWCLFCLCVLFLIVLVVFFFLLWLLKDKGFVNVVVGWFLISEVSVLWFMGVIGGLFWRRRNVECGNMGCVVGGEFILFILICVLIIWWVFFCEREFGGKKKEFRESVG